jgi:hypothetical protein
MNLQENISRIREMMGLREETEIKDIDMDISHKYNPKVIEIQKELINKGYYIGKFGDDKDGIDGIYGPITKAAHESYKKEIPPEKFKSELESTTSKKELEKIDTEYKKFKEDKVENIKNDNKNIIIGDSITPHLAKVGGTGFSSGPKALNATDYSGVGLWFGGIGLGGLQKMADAYKTVHPKVKNVVITIGTNGYGGTGGVSTLATNLKRIFPNAKLFVCQGAYGPKWKSTGAPSLAKYTDKYIDTFYSAFTNAGITVVPYPIKDTVLNVHSPSVPVYKKWALFINNNAN